MILDLFLLYLMIFMHSAFTCVVHVHGGTSVRPFLMGRPKCVAGPCKGHELV